MENGEARSWLPYKKLTKMEDEGTTNSSYGFHTELQTANQCCPSQTHSEKAKQHVLQITTNIGVLGKKKGAHLTSKLR